ncbi:hypothetical protein BGW80DRAFT_1453395 [Lactifluus volemus]|nr:hypothetical protein BGW80DRAFT_1453395 [Lactifluus volemus]
MSPLSLLFVVFALMSLNGVFGAPSCTNGLRGHIAKLSSQSVDGNGTSSGPALAAYYTPPAGTYTSSTPSNPTTSPSVPSEEPNAPVSNSGSPTSSPSSTPRPTSSHTPTPTPSSTNPSSSNPASSTPSSTGSVSSADIDAYLWLTTPSIQAWSQSSRGAIPCMLHRIGQRCIRALYGPTERTSPPVPVKIPDAVKLWADEVVDYDPKNPVYSHFTQMVWKSTTQLGCAVQTCNGIIGSGPANYYVCEYNPPGNVEGEFGDNVQV